MLVQLDCAADYTAIVMEAAVPIRIAEHQVWSTIRAVLIGAVKETAEIWLNSQHVEVVASRGKARGDSWIVTRIESDKGEGKRCQIIEAPVAIAQIDIVGIRLKTFIDPIHSSIEVLGVGHI